ncbi:unnamed protein product [Bursaphelenchus okinawaensis]|uniref:Nuclear receptor domain-containing protein n=1 Tax=Bursaphelenchus okinawaensis TaxID=465554 RepID=A0A811KWI4_9BILA|nr:unnamed protein product [Bursaphelenchus okinawaensis]CAG9113039.1 unnamed protein product [Bursaphelenchus okinawaensis]
MKKPCQICGTETKSVCYKLYICAACTMFYRRNYRLQKDLKCRLMNSCDLKTSDRRICRACRLRECRALGLRMVGKSLVVQQNGIPEDDMPDEDVGSLPESCIVSASSSSPVSATVSRIPDPMMCSTPSTSTAPQMISHDQLNELNNLNNVRVQLVLAMNNTEFEENKEGIRNCNVNNMLSVYTLNNPDSIILKAIRLYTRFEERHKQYASLQQLNNTSGSSVHVRSMSYKTIESNVMTFACYYAIELLEDFHGLSSTEKFSVIKTIQSVMIFMHKFVATARLFPTSGDTRISIIDGYHLDMKQYAYFLSDLETEMTPSQLIEQYNRCRVIVEPFFESIYHSAESFRLLMPDPIECAVLFCTCVLEKMEHLQIGAEQSRNLRNNLFAELSVYLGERYSVQELGTRIMRLTATLYEIKLIAEKYDDMFSLLGVFVADKADCHPSLTRPAVSAEHMKNIQAMLNITSAFTANSLIFTSEKSKYI